MSRLFRTTVNAETLTTGWMIPLPHTNNPPKEVCQPSDCYGKKKMYLQCTSTCSFFAWSLRGSVEI